jgi:hypothetical protein
MEARYAIPRASAASSGFGTVSSLKRSCTARPICFFSALTVSADGFFYLEWRVFENGNTMVTDGDHYDAATLRDIYTSFEVGWEEEFFYSSMSDIILPYDFLQILHDFHEFLSLRCFRSGMNNPVGQYSSLIFLEFYHGKADIRGSRIYPEDNRHGDTLSKKLTFPKKLLDVVEYYLQKTFFFEITCDFLTEKSYIFECDFSSVSFFAESPCFYYIWEIFPEFSMTECIVEWLFFCWFTE